MALTFNGLAKTITWSGGALSVRDMWSRYVDWLAEGDNSKFGSMLYTVGMDTPDIPFYVFMDIGVIMVITNNSISTSIWDGVLKTPDDHDPFGGAIVNVRYEAPGIAIGYGTSSGSGSTVSEISDAVTLALTDKLNSLLSTANFLALKD